VGSAPALPAYGRSGIRHIGGLSLEEAVAWNVGTWVLMLTEKSQVAGTTRARVRMRHPGADYLVVVLKRSNVRGAKGVGHPVGTFKWANWKQEELAGCGGGRQLSQGWHEPCDGRLSSTDL
jgi:hypothetical protein